MFVFGYATNAYAYSLPDQLNTDVNSFATDDVYLRIGAPDVNSTLTSFKIKCDGNCPSFDTQQLLKCNTGDYATCTSITETTNVNYCGITGDELECNFGTGKTLNAGYLYILHIDPTTTAVLKLGSSNPSPFNTCNYESILFEGGVPKGNNYPSCSGTYGSVAGPLAIAFNGASFYQETSVSLTMPTTTVNYLQYGEFHVSISDITHNPYWNASTTNRLWFRFVYNEKNISYPAIYKTDVYKDFSGSVTSTGIIASAIAGNFFSTNKATSTWNMQGYLYSSDPNSGGEVIASAGSIEFYVENGNLLDPQSTWTRYQTATTTDTFAYKDCSTYEFIDTSGYIPFFASTSLDKVQCYFQNGVTFWAQLLFKPSQLKKDDMQNTLDSFKKVFPFNIVYTLKDSTDKAIQNASTTSPSNLSMNIHGTNVVLLSSSTLSNFIGEENKNTYFTIVKSILYLGTAITIISMI